MATCVEVILENFSGRLEKGVSKVLADPQTYVNKLVWWYTLVMPVPGVQRQVDLGSQAV